MYCVVFLTIRELNLLYTVGKGSNMQKILENQLKTNTELLRSNLSMSPVGLNKIISKSILNFIEQGFSSQVLAYTERKNILIQRCIFIEL